MPDENMLDMPDEEFEKLATPDFSEKPEDKEEESTTSEEETTEEQEEEEVEEESEETTEDEETSEKEEDDSEESEENKEDESKETEEDDKEQTQEEIDYKAAYEELMGPTKASGREITPKSIADAKRLIQMGFDYHDKMAGMKPARKALKTLENNELLDNEKLSLLIDAGKGNIEALTKLIKDHGIDPLDLKGEEASTYTPQNYSASDEEVDLDNVLDIIKSTPTYDTTVDHITNRWDEQSQTAVAKDPQIITVINEHVSTGVYDTVMKEVQYQQSLGKLAGVPTLHAYKQVGDAMAAEGVFDAPATSEKKAENTTQTKTVDPVKEKARLAKKKAATSTKTSVKKQAKLPKNFNPLDLPDEEFDKFDPKLLGIK